LSARHELKRKSRGLSASSAKVGALMLVRKLRVIRSAAGALGRLHIVQSMLQACRPEDAAAEDSVEIASTLPPGFPTGGHIYLAARASRSEERFPA
jgi:hypothetical protein